MSIIVRCLSAAKAFTNKWTSLSRPSPFGKKIYSAPFYEKCRNIWKGYHVTQLNRVKNQIEKGKFDNKNRDIYFHPFLESKKSPLKFGGKTVGCWTAEDPVILGIASSRFWRWDLCHRYPYFPRGPKQSVVILGAWRCNPAWKTYMRHCNRRPTFREKCFDSIDAARNVLNSSYKAS